MNDKVDRGDDLSQEQIDTARRRAEASEGRKLSDDEFQRAVKILQDGTLDEDDDPGEGGDQENGDKQERLQGSKSSDESGDDQGKSKDNSEKTGDQDEGGRGVPQDRFNEAVGKERARADAAEQKYEELNNRFIAVLQGKDPDAPNQETPEQRLEKLEIEVDEIRERYEDAIADNDRSAMSQIRAELRQAERALRNESMAQAEARARQGSSQDTAYNTRLAKLEAEFPQINPDAEEYDPEIEKKISRLYHGLVRGGTDPISALDEAADVYLRPQIKANAEETLRDRGKKAATKVAGSPPDHSGIGKGKADIQETLKPTRMTKKQYASLDENTRARLRGDVPDHDTA